ncbi:19585_t:CDS:2 [Funneliformis geosporum]|nr:19585_t:CDS:2 [Funneliformis geosporum]
MPNNWKHKVEQIKVEEEEKYNSDVYDNMDDNDLIQTDEPIDENQVQELLALETSNRHAIPSIYKLVPCKQGIFQEDNAPPHQAKIAADVCNAS